MYYELVNGTFVQLGQRVQGGYVHAHVPLKDPRVWRAIPRPVSFEEWVCLSQWALRRKGHHEDGGMDVWESSL